jgi:hypothetical protein
VILGLLLPPTGFSQGVTQTVGPEGGTVVSPDGVTVTIAPGLKRPVRITIERISPSRLSSKLRLYPGETVISPYYSISASESVFIVNNSQPVEVRIPLPQGVKREEVVVNLHYWGESESGGSGKKYVWRRSLIDSFSTYPSYISKLYDLDFRPITYVLVRRG